MAKWWKANFKNLFFWRVAADTRLSTGIESE
jgi:hypothetical protein